MVESGTEQLRPARRYDAVFDREFVAPHGLRFEANKSLNLDGKFQSRPLNYQQPAAMRVSDNLAKIIQDLSFFSRLDSSHFYSSKTIVKPKERRLLVDHVQSGVPILLYGQIGRMFG